MKSVLWASKRKTYHYSQRTSWSQASSQKGLWALSRPVCRRGGPSRLPPDRDRRRRHPRRGAAWCHLSSIWSPRYTAPCGPGPSLCWPELSPAWGQIHTKKNASDVGSVMEIIIWQFSLDKKNQFQYEGWEGKRCALHQWLFLKCCSDTKQINLMWLKKSKERQQRRGNYELWVPYPPQ